jgi:protein-export membrane protein SecD
MLTFSRWTIWSSIAACVLAIVFALPNILPKAALDAMPDWLPKQTINLGLDLQGGVYLLLEADVDFVYKERLESARDDLRQKLNDARIRYTGLSLHEGNAVEVTIRDAGQFEAAAAIIQEMVVPVEASLIGGSAQNFDLTRGDNGLFRLTQTEGARTYYRTQTLAQSIEIVRKRVDELGTKEPTIQQQGADRILLQVPGLNDPQRLKDLIGKTAKLQFRFVNEGADVQAAVAGRVPAGSELLYEERDGQQVPYVIETRVIVTGEQLVDAQQGVDQRNNEVIVSFQFDTQGARRFGDATKQNVGRRFAVVLDNRVLTAPVINEPILSGSGQISGSFTFESANDLAILLRAGALPAPLEVAEERTVGPELGADSIESGTTAAAVGVGLIVVLMIACYGLFGFFAVVGLLLNLVITLAIMTAIGATLTLPGIAGLILSIGMTIDANVLFYERMREERDNGKLAASSLSGGFEGAKSAIFDANITQLLACVILFQLGAGPVRGFAVTLGLGVAVSMFTAVVLTRIMVVSWYRWRRPRVLPI